ncbi:uncharacterized protein RCC_04210 [Ramularia collo-cygni]|uniref:Uncharacterized protein n=1 Tax=Ramularia collo-cygni TaxID=112498 RepID=A0A2D3V4B2_9PEZI|nr:uncharacterized protein RCC_04210 [Ramularia collo-cygni]CZT18366.1 uncharacterized protein RCC_04210 [Ramularia collo-cygni]
MTPRSRAPKATRRSTPAAATSGISKAGQRRISTKPGIRTPPKPRQKSKRFQEAKDGDMSSMVKVGWGAEKMLATYNETQVAKGLPTVEQIDDPHVLSLIETRKNAQQANTRRYQARKTKQAALGDIDAARKLKWSDQRIKSLHLWVRNGRIGIFDQKLNQEDDEDSEDSEDSEDFEGESEAESEEELEAELEENPEYDFDFVLGSEPDAVRKLEPEMDLEDNIQVAGPPVDGWPRKMLHQDRTPPAMPSYPSENITMFDHDQSADDEKWEFSEEISTGYPDVMSLPEDNAPGSPEGSATNSWFELLRNDHADFPKVRTNTELPYHSQQHMSMTHPRTDGASSSDPSIYDNSYLPYNTNNGFEQYASRTGDPWSLAGDHQLYASQDDIHARQYEFDEASRALHLAQERVNEANRELLDTKQRSTFMDHQMEWLNMNQ